MGLLDLDDSVPTMAYRGFVAILREDATLARIGPTWALLDGSSKTMQPPLTSEMPWICVVPAGHAMEKVEEASYEMRLGLGCAIATRGLDFADHANLWGAFVAAINQEKAFRDTRNDLWMRAQGCFLYGLTGGGPVPVPRPAPNKKVASQDLYSEVNAVLKLRIDF